MSDAQLEKTIVSVATSNSKDIFTATGEVVKFDGFLTVYMESSDDENTDDAPEGLLPPLNVGQVLQLNEITATEKFTYPPARYTEASLVKTRRTWYRSTIYLCTYHFYYSEKRLCN